MNQNVNSVTNTNKPQTKPKGAKKPDQEADDIAQFDGKLFRRIISYLAPYKKWVVIAFALNFVGALMGPLRPYLTQIAIDQHIVFNDTEGLTRIIMLLFGVLVLEGVLSYFNNYLTSWIGQQAIYDLRIKVFDHIQHLPLSFFDKTPIGKLITRTTSDVEALNTVLSAGVVTIVGNLLNLFFITYFMFALSWKMALISLAVVPVMVYITFLFRKVVRGAFRETRKQVAILNTFLNEHVTGMKIVQVYNREEEEYRRFVKVNDDNRVAQIKTVFYFALFWPAVDVIAAIALGLVIWFGGGEAIQGTMTLGILIAFIQYVRQFFEPIRQLSDQYNTLQSAMAASERLFQLLDTPTGPKEIENPVRLSKISGKIEFQNVWFTYDEGVTSDTLANLEYEPNWILRDISFTVEAGQTVAVVGPTGSGKTTLINLLLRFYEIQKGRILLDGVNIHDLPLDELRKSIGLVLQDVFLFSGSIYRNITLGNEAISDPKVHEATQQIGADSFIERLSDGYNHDVKERGAGLSHGQRQLLSFARAVAYNPAVLVLDEATSSIDTESEELIQNALDKMFDGRSSIVIAHRLSTIQNADQILVVHKGVLREKGNHQELLNMNGLYRRLYELQYKEQEIDLD